MTKEKLHVGYVLKNGALIIDMLENSKIEDDKKRVLVYFEGHNYYCEIGEKPTIITSNSENKMLIHFAEKSSKGLRVIPDSARETYTKMKVGDTILNTGSASIGGNIVIKRVSTENQSKGLNLDNDFVVVNGIETDY